MNESFLEREGKMRLYATAFTRRHIGTARPRDTSPAAISNCGTVQTGVATARWALE